MSSTSSYVDTYVFLYITYLSKWVLVDFSQTINEQICFSIVNFANVTLSREMGGPLLCDTSQHLSITIENTHLCLKHVLKRGDKTGAFLHRRRHEILLNARNDNPLTKETYVTRKIVVWLAKRDARLKD